MNEFDAERTRDENAKRKLWFLMSKLEIGFTYHKHSIPLSLVGTGYGMAIPVNAIWLPIVDTYYHYLLPKAKSDL